VDGYTHAIDVSLKGLDATKQQEVIAKALAGFGEGMAERVLGAWTTTLDTTITEMVTQFEGSYGPEGSGGLVTSEVTRTVKGTSTYKPSEFAKEGETAVQTLTRLATSLTAVNSSFALLGNSLLDVSLAGADVASTLIAAMGGMEKFSSAFTSYYENYYSAEEKRANTVKAITAELKKAGSEISESDVAGATRAQFRAATEQVLAAAGAGSPLYVALIQVSGAFASITPELGAVAQAVSEIMNGLIRDRDNLNVQLLEAKGDTAGAADLRRALDTVGYSAAELAVYDYNKALEGQIDALKIAADTQKQVADERLGLEKQLLQAQGNTIELRRMERAALDAGNRAIYDRIQALEDATAVESARVTVASQYEAFAAAVASTQQGVEGASASITSGYLGALDAVAAAQDEITSATLASGQSLVDFAKQIREFTSGLDRSEQGGLSKADQFAANQADFSIAAAQARAGDKDALGRLTGLAGSLLTLGEGQSSSASEYRILVANTRNTLDSIAATTEGSTAVAAALDPVAAAQNRLVKAQETLAQWTKAVSESGASTDKQVTDYAADWRKANEAYRVALGDKNLADKMVEGLDLVLKTPLQNLADALQGLGLAMVKQQITAAATGVPAAPVVGAGAPTEQVIRKDASGGYVAATDSVQNNDVWKSTGGAIAKLESGVVQIYGKDGSKFTGEHAIGVITQALQANNPMAVYNAALKVGLSANTLDTLMGAALGTSNAWAVANGLPRFARGGMHTGGLRIVGENGPELESTGPSRIFNAQQTSAMFGGNSARLESLVEGLTAEVQRLQGVVAAGNVHAEKTKNVLVRVTQNGETMLTTAA